MTHCVASSWVYFFMSSTMHGQTVIKFAVGLNTAVHAESTAIGVSLILYDDVTVVYVDCEQVGGLSLRRIQFIVLPRIFCMCWDSQSGYLNTRRESISCAVGPAGKAKHKSCGLQRDCGASKGLAARRSFLPPGHSPSAGRYGTSRSCCLLFLILSESLYSVSHSMLIPTPTLVSSVH